MKYKQETFFIACSSVYAYIDMLFKMYIAVQNE